MSSTLSTLRGFRAMLHRDLVVYVSYRSRLVSQALTSLFSLTLFYYVPLTWTSRET